MARRRGRDVLESFGEARCRVLGAVEVDVLVDDVGRAVRVALGRLARRFRLAGQPDRPRELSHFGARGA